MAGASPLPNPYVVKVWNSDGQLSNGVSLTLTDAVYVSPPSGPPGTQFAYTGQGLTGSSTATSYLLRPDNPVSPLSTAMAADGTFSHPINSSSFTPGAYEVWAVDGVTNVSSRHAPFSVTALPVITATNDSYTMTQGTTLTVPAPGVMA